MSDPFRVEVDGLVAEVSGPDSGMPVIFGHSLLFDSRIFAAQVADLQSDFRCINLDFRGHGQSAPAPSGFAITDQAEDYAKVLDHLGLERAAIVGLSMGGMAAMHFALAHPRRTIGLVLLNTSAAAESAAVRAKDMALAVTARLFGVRPFIQRQVAALMFSARFRADSPAVVETWLQRMATLDRAGLYRAVQMVVARKAIAGLADIRVPTFAIAGDEDRAIPLSNMHAIVDTIPGAELCMLPRTGHISTVEEPIVTTKLIRIWLTLMRDRGAS